MFASGTFERHGTWKEDIKGHLPQPEPLTGKTRFYMKNASQDHSSITNNPNPAHSREQQLFQAEIILNTDDVQKCLGRTYDYQETFLASAAKRQKVEVKLRDLSPEDAKLFAKAKDKELESWLATDTV